MECDQLEDLGSGGGIRAAAYLRVSSKKQAKEGLSLEDQEVRLRELARKIGVSRIYWFVDAGISGRDFDRRKLNSILDLAEKREIQKLLVAYVDRLGRDSRKLVNFFWELSDYSVTIQTPEEEIDVKKLEGWLISAIKAWSAQDVNEQRGKSALAGRVRSFVKKRWNKQVPRGYRRREDGWIEKAPGWDILIKDVFGTFIALWNYDAVKGTISKKYDQRLTSHQIKKILQNPVYIGKPQFSGRAMIKEFQKAVVVEDPTLSYIDGETFEKAQEIIRRLHQKNSRKKTDALNNLIDDYGIEVLDHIPNLAVLCPKCSQPMIKNGTLTLDGLTTRNYLCKKCEKQLRIPTRAHMRRIREWASRQDQKEQNRHVGNWKVDGKTTTIDEFLEPSPDKQIVQGEAGDPIQGAKAND